MELIENERAFVDHIYETELRANINFVQTKMRELTSSFLVFDGYVCDEPYCANENSCPRCSTDDYDE